MKNVFFILPFFLVTLFCFSQDNDYSRVKEGSFGLSFDFTAPFPGYEWGIGLSASEDFDNSGLGMGAFVQYMIWVPNETLSDIVTAGGALDAMLKYDIGIERDIELSLLGGLGYYSVFFEESSDTVDEFYVGAGANLTYFLGSTSLSFQFINRFLEGSGSSLGLAIRF